MATNKPNKIGNVYGEIEVIGYKGNLLYECRCLRCNQIFNTKTFNLCTQENKGQKVCPNCKDKEIKPLKGKKVGNRYGKLLVKEFLGNKEYRCLCDCGNYCIVKTTELRFLDKRRCTTSCGCDKIHYDKDEKFFDNIDTEEKAYILGLIVSDGHVNYTNGNIKITLKYTDREILEKIKDVIKYTGPIKEKDIITKLPQGTFKSSRTAELVISSKRLIEPLHELGIEERKSFELETRFSLDNIPEHLIRHFLRGLWDGDGTCNITRSSTGRINYRITIVGSTSILRQIKKYLSQKFIGFNFNLYASKRLKEYTSKLESGNSELFVTFTDFLYKDAKIYLERKYKLYLANRKIMEIINSRKRENKGKKINFLDIEINNKDLYI